MQKLWLSIPPGRRKWGVRIAVAFAAYSVFGFLIAPAILKWQLLKQLPGITKRNAEVRQVRMNPWTLSLTIRELRLAEPDGEEFASWEELYVNFQASSLFRWAWTFKEIRLVRPLGVVILQKDGKLNFANMFPEAAPEPEPEPGSKSAPRLRVFTLAITNGFVALEDHTRRTRFRTEYRPINLLLNRLTTRPGTATPYSFQAHNESGQSLMWKGNIIVQPFSSHGSIGIVGAEPMRYQPYFEDFTTAQVVAGRSDIVADYWFSVSTNGVDLTASNASFRISGLEVRDSASQESVLKVPAFALEKVWFDLRTRTTGAERVALEKAQLVTRRERDGSINLLNLLLRRGTNGPAEKLPSQEPATPPPPATAPWLLNVGTFEVKETSVSYRDLSTASVFETQLAPIDLTVEKFTTAPEEDARFNLSLKTEADETLGGSGTVSINPVRSSGEIRLASVQLRKYWPYMEAFLKGGIQDGQINVTLPYRADFGSNSLQAAVSNVLVRVSDLKIHGPDSDETLFAVPSFAVENAEANLAERVAKVARIKIDGGSLLARRTADGKINLLSLLKPSDQQSTTAQGAPPDNTGQVAPANEGGHAEPKHPWNATVDEFDLSGYSIAFEDSSLSNTARIKLEQLALNAKGITAESNRPITLRFSTLVNETGQVALQGEVCPMPPRADVEIGITNIDLSAAQPYLEQHVTLTLNKGFLGMNGRVVWQNSDTNSGSTRFTGHLEATEFQASDKTTFREFVRWASLRIGGIDFSLQPNFLKVAEVELDGLNTSLTIDTNKQINLLSVVPTKTKADFAQPPPSESAETPGRRQVEPSAKNPGVPFPLTVDHLILTNGSFHFSDASIQPQCVFDIQRFNGTISGLSSDPASTAILDLRGHIDEQAPFAVLGRINPLSPVLKLDVSISNSNVQLPAFTPYMQKYVGHPLNKGRLSLDLRYEINDQQLKAQNKFVIDQLMLGPRDANSDATKLPVKLAIALLKDRNGVIDMDVPVEGRLDDPQFRVGKVVLGVIVNLITKAATSPFKMLGALVGGGEELSFVEFAPGTTTLLEGETNKIDKLVRALVERPAISLEISASIDPHRDRDFLARESVRTDLKKARLQELAATGRDDDQETADLNPVDRERLLRAALAREFGTNLHSALREFVAAQAATNAAALTNRQATLAAESRSSKGVVARFIGWLPIRGKNSPAGIARRQAKADAALLKANPELATITWEDMEGLLASRTEVPTEQLQNLLRSRAQAIQQMLLQGGAVSADRLYMVTPKTPDLVTPGLPRATLSIN